MRRTGYAIMTVATIGAAWVLFDNWDVPQFGSGFWFGVFFFYLLREGRAFVDAGQP